MANLNKVDFDVQTATLFPTNGTGQIAAKDLRQHFTNVSDSFSMFVSGFTTAPGLTDDGNNTSGNGFFAVGQIWIDDFNEKAYMCLDNSTSVAVWVGLGISISGNVTKTGTPQSGDFAVWQSDGVLGAGAALNFSGGNLTVPNGININDVTLEEVGTFTGSALTSIDIDSFVSNSFMSAKYHMVAVDTVTNERQVSELMLVITHGGADVMKTEYAQISTTGSQFVEFGAYVNAGVLFIEAYPTTTNVITYTFSRKLFMV